MQCGRHRFSASWFDEHEHREPASQNMLLRCQRKTVLRSNQSALLILLADYAMGDKLAGCIRRLDFYAHITVPEQRGKLPVMSRS